MSTSGLEYEDRRRKKYGPVHIDLPKADMDLLKDQKNKLGLIDAAASDIKKEERKIRRGGWEAERLDEIKDKFNNLVGDKDVGRFLDAEQIKLCRTRLADIGKLVREVENLELKYKKGSRDLKSRIDDKRKEMDEMAEKFYAEANKLEDGAMAEMKKQEEQSVISAEKEKKIKEAIEMLEEKFGMLFGDRDDSDVMLRHEFSKRFGSKKNDSLNKPKEKTELSAVLENSGGMDDADQEVLNAKGEDADKFIESMGLKEKVASLGAEGAEIRLIAAWGLDLDKTKEEIKEEVDEKIAEILSRHSEQNSTSSQKTREILGQIMAGRKSADSSEKEQLGENFSLLDQIPALGESGLRLKNAVESLVNAGLTSAEEKKMREKLRKLYNALAALRTKKREYSQLVLDASNLLGANGPAVAYEKAGGVIVDAFLPLDKTGSINIEELVADSLERAGEEIRSNYAALPAGDITDLNAEKEKRSREEGELTERKGERLLLNAENFETMFYVVLLVKTFSFSHPQAGGEQVRGFVIEHLRDRKIELSEAQADCLDRFLVSELDYKYVEQDTDRVISERTRASQDVDSQTTSAGKLIPDKTAVEEIKSKAKKMGAEVVDKIKRRKDAVDDILDFLTDDGDGVPHSKEDMEKVVRRAKELIYEYFKDKKEVKKIWEEVAESLKNSDLPRANKLHKIWVTQFFK